MLFLVFLVFLKSLCEDIFVTVAYCPTIYTGKGAVVKVDSMTGKWEIIGTFEITYYRTKNELFLDFLDDFGFEIILDLEKAKIVKHVKPDDPFMIGFVNTGYDEKDKELVGAVPTGKSTGEFQYMTMKADTGKVQEKKYIQFKAMMDDSHYLDEDKKNFWVQASYDIREGEHCAPHDTDLCLLKLDSRDGGLEKATFTNWTIYKYNRHFNPDGTIKAFVEGFDEICKHPYNNYLFANIDLEKAEAKPIACIDRNVTIQMDEWISSFSSDGKYMTTGSRFDGMTQFLVFDTSNGKVVMQTKLEGLAEKLGAYGKLYWIWAVDYKK